MYMVFIHPQRLDFYLIALPYPSGRFYHHSLYSFIYQRPAILYLLHHMIMYLPCAMAGLFDLLFFHPSSFSVSYPRRKHRGIYKLKIKMNEFLGVISSTSVGKRSFFHRE